jgi:hypothetical protein
MRLHCLPCCVSPTGLPERARTSGGGIRQVWVLTVLLALAGFFAAPAQGATRGVILSWSPNPEDDIAFYRVYRGFYPALYTVSNNVGLATITTNLTPIPGLAYHFAVTAVNEAGLESELSDGVQYFVPPDGTPVGLSTVSLQTLEDTPIRVLFGAVTNRAGAEWIPAMPPAFGELRGTLPHAVDYLPATNAHGQVSFQYYVVAGPSDVSRVTVKVDVAPVPDPPRAFDVEHIAPNDAPLSIALLGLDPDGDPITFRVISQPSRGQLSGSPPVLTYTPEEGVVGIDEFQYVAFDGTFESEPATIRIQLEDPNPEPLVHYEAMTVQEDTPTPVVLHLPNGPASTATYTILQEPDVGTLSGSPPNLVYTPPPDFNGSDSFRYLAIPPVGLPTEVTTRVTVQAVNDPPIPSETSLVVVEGVPALVRLSASDVDGDALSYMVISGAEHGTLWGDAPAFQYEPDPGFTGEDVIRFQAFDGELWSEVGEIRITVIPATSVFPRIEHAWTQAGTVMLRWRAIPGWQYRVLHKANLSDPAWTSVASVPANGSEFMTWPVAPGAESGFYSVAVIPP